MARHRSYNIAALVRPSALPPINVSARVCTHDKCALPFMSSFSLSEISLLLPHHQGEERQPFGYCTYPRREKQMPGKWPRHRAQPQRGKSSHTTQTLPSVSGAMCEHPTQITTYRSDLRSQAHTHAHRAPKNARGVLRGTRTSVHPPLA